MNLDIVRENQDLEFPENVEYDFVYWEHVSKNHPAMLDAVKDSDVAAMEVVGLEGSPLGSSVKWLQRSLRNENAVLRGDTNLKAKFLTTLYRHGAKNNTTTDFASHYAGSGKKLYYIDAWEHADDPSHVTQIGKRLMKDGVKYDYTNPDATRVSCEAEALYIAARESIVLRQLADIGKENAKPSAEDITKVSVVLGARHTMVSVAAHALGARVKRTFLHDRRKVYTFSHDHLMRTMRLYGIDSDEARRLYSAQYMARYAAADYLFGEEGGTVESMHDLFTLETVSSLLAMDLMKTETTDHAAASVVRACFEDKYTANKLTLTDVERTALASLHDRIMKGYIDKAERFAAR